jgi:Xaa-Pro aminopeptidase
MRISKLREKTGELDGFIITNQINIRWLTHYTGDNGLLFITKDNAFIFTDFRYKESSEREVKNAEIIIIKEGLVEDLKSSNIMKNLKKIGFESEAVTYRKFEKLRSLFNDKELIPLRDEVENLRMLKDEKEIRFIREAQRITDEVFRDIKKSLHKDMTEKDVRANIEFLMHRKGAEKPSFETICASGKNSSLPHARPTNKKIKGFFTIDMGVFFNGYASDMTRTLIIGEPTEKQREIYNTVLEAQNKAISAIKPGIKLKDLDKIARDVIKSAGYAKYFGHALGHGVGLEIHEKPKVSEKSTEVATPGMVFTIEPGVYIPDFGGVRIEDLIVVKENGKEDITHSPKSLQEMATPI